VLRLQPVHPGVLGLPSHMQGHTAMQQQQAALQQAQMAAAHAAVQQQSGRGVGFPPITFDHQGRGRGIVGGRGRGRKRKERDLNRAPRQPSQYNLFMKTEVARIKQVCRTRAHLCCHAVALSCALNERVLSVPTQARRALLCPFPLVGPVCGPLSDGI
jgi:hypothetical protein